MNTQTAAPCTGREENFTTGPAAHTPQRVYPQYASLAHATSTAPGWITTTDGVAIYDTGTTAAIIYPLRDLAENGVFVTASCSRCHQHPRNLNQTDSEHVIPTADDSPHRIIHRAMIIAEELANNPAHWHAAPCRPSNRPF